MVTAAPSCGKVRDPLRQPHRLPHLSHRLIRNPAGPAGAVRVLRYGDLRVTDADGRGLVAQLEVLAGSPVLLRIVVEDAGARYPVTVDPWIAAPDWMAQANQDDALFGCLVATAGDTAGDGYADVIVGAPQRNSGAGAFHLYYGAGSRGLSLNPQQRLADGTGPIAYLGAAEGTAFRLALRGRTPFGRGIVELQWEVKPLGTPFDGTDLGTSRAWVDTGTVGAALEALIDSLSWDRAYHWRVRLLYHPASTPFQQRSRWLTQPWNGWQEARLRTGESADLSLSKADAPDPVPVAEALTYTLSVGNDQASETAANWVVVTDMLPAGAGFMGAGGVD